MELDLTQTVKVYRISGDGGAGGLICHGTEWGMGDIIQDQTGQPRLPDLTDRNRRRRDEAAEFLADDAAAGGYVYDKAVPTELEDGDLIRHGCRVVMLREGEVYDDLRGELCLTQPAVRHAVMWRLPLLTEGSRIEVHDCDDPTQLRAVFEKDMTLAEVRDLGEFDGF